MEIRPLRADEVEVRVGQVPKSGRGCSLLLYKDARCDMRVLDEMVGPFGWTCAYEERKGTLFCGVALRDGAGEWVWKWDAGTPSDMEAQKGEASDAFKRACFRWGIGRELYTAPFIWVKAEDARLEQRGQKLVPAERFKVSEMEVEAGQIVALTISTLQGRDVFRWGLNASARKAQKAPQTQPDKAPHLQPVRDLIKAYAKARQLHGPEAMREVAQWAGVEHVRDLTPEMVPAVAEMMRGVVGQVA